jgi:cytochrome c biogenesis protein CcmG/thiol:disulfide interchange protein DsbE
VRRSLLALALVALVACTSSHAAKEIPDLTFTRFDGTTAHLRDYEGKPLVVNFFASWCVPCTREMPAFQAEHQAQGDKVQFLGLAVNDRPEDAQGLIDATKVTYALGLDPKSKVITALGGAAMPTTLFISADGVVVGMHTGELKQDELETLIKQRLFPG